MNVARAKTLFPRDADGTADRSASAGMAWVPVTINRPRLRYDQYNQAHLNIHEAAAKNEKYTGGRFVRDDKSEMLIIYGYEKNLPPLDPNDKGHFHAESAEMWLVFTGQIRYAFEGQQPFIASEGDIVYVPAGTWHATRFIGRGAACRLVDHRVRGEHAAARTEEIEREHASPPSIKCTEFFGVPGVLGVPALLGMAAGGDRPDGFDLVLPRGVHLRRNGSRPGRSAARSTRAIADLVCLVAPSLNVITPNSSEPAL